MDIAIKETGSSPTCRARLGGIQKYAHSLLSEELEKSAEIKNSTSIQAEINGYIAVKETGSISGILGVIQSACSNVVPVPVVTNTDYLDRVRYSMAYTYFMPPTQILC
jgi:hypothetical protein